MVVQVRGAPSQTGSLEPGGVREVVPRNGVLRPFQVSSLEGQIGRMADWKEFHSKAIQVKEAS